MTTNSGPSIEPLREWLLVFPLRDVYYVDVKNALAAYDALQREVESLRGERDRLIADLQRCMGDYPRFTEARRLLQACLETGLRDDKTRQLYVDVCKWLGKEPL